MTTLSAIVITLHVLFLIYVCLGLPVKSREYRVRRPGQPATFIPHNDELQLMDKVTGNDVSGQGRRYFVVYRKSSTADDRKRVLQNIDAKRYTPVRFSGEEWHLVTGPRSIQGASILMDDAVDFIEEDTAVVGDECLYQNLTGSNWGLDRIDEGSFPSFNNTFTYPDIRSGEHDDPVNVYILDSGAHARHPALRGRARFLRNFISRDPYDSSNHGTGVAAIIGSQQFGVAKTANLLSIRVLMQTNMGSYYAAVGTIGTVIRGLEAALQHFQRSETKGVVNLSSGSSRSPALDLAARMLVEAGLPVVVSAGNDNKGADFRSPAREPSVITVGAANSFDNREQYSNYGPEVNIHAPGHEIHSAATMYRRTNSAPTFLAYGTSFAAPFVTGVIAEFLRRIPEQPSPADVTQFLIDSSTPGILRNVPADTDNFYLRSLRCEVA